MTQFVLSASVCICIYFDDDYEWHEMYVIMLCAFILRNFDKSIEFIIGI